LIKILLEKGLDRNPPETSETPLICPLLAASLAGYAETAGLLLFFSANPNWLTAPKHPYPFRLYAASTRHYAPIVTQLLKAGADINMKPYPETLVGMALHAAIGGMADVETRAEFERGCETVKVLVQKGARVDVKAYYTFQKSVWEGSWQRRRR
jgi:hypothetical protein